MKIFELIRLFKVKNGRSPTPGELDQLKVLSQQQEMNKNVIQFPKKDKLKAQIDAEPNMLQRELMEVSDDVSPSYASGDTKYNAQVLADGLAEKRYNVEFDDLDQYEQIALYDEAYKYLTQLRKNFKQPEFPPKEVMDNLDAEGLANIMRKKGIDMEVGTASKTTKKKPNIDPELQAMDDQNEMFKDFSKRVKDMSPADRVAERLRDLKGVELSELSGIDAQKIASEVIGRKGPFKTISSKGAKEVLGELEPIIKRADADDLGTKLKNFDGDPDAMAEGGIIGLKEGGPPNPGRRNFMKIMAGLAAIPVFGKFFKGAKVAKTVVPLTNTSTVMPAWFPKLIDKAMDRGIKNKIDADLMEIEVPELPGVKIQRHDDGRVFVEGQNEYGRPYAIEYEPPGYTMVDEATGKSVKTKGDFRALDSVPEAAGPEDVPDFFPRELDEVDDILGSDVRVMEEFATGSKIKNPKRGESAISQAELRAESAAEEAAERAAMEADEGFAKGGLAYLLGEE